MPKCENCQKEFIASNHRLAKNRFCDMACYQAWKTIKGMTTSKCAGCGQPFKHHTYLKKRFCSKPCQRTWRKGIMIGNKRVANSLGIRWSYKYDKCVECGRTDRKHYAKGRCEVCDGRLRSRIARNTLNKSCIICGESRVVDAAHLVSRKIVGERWDEWLTTPLCPTHHRLLDLDRLSEEEYAVIKPLIDKAKARWDEEQKTSCSDRRTELVA